MSNRTNTLDCHAGDDESSVDMNGKTVHNIDSNGASKNIIENASDPDKVDTHNNGLSNTENEEEVFEIIEEVTLVEDDDIADRPAKSTAQMEDSSPSIYEEDSSKSSFYDTESIDSDQSCYEIKFSSSEENEQACVFTISDCMDIQNENSSSSSLANKDGSDTEILNSDKDRKENSINECVHLSDNDSEPDNFIDKNSATEAVVGKISINADQDVIHTAEEESCTISKDSFSSDQEVISDNVCDKNDFSNVSQEKETSNISNVVLPEKHSSEDSEDNLKERPCKKQRVEESENDNKTCSTEEEKSIPKEQHLKDELDDSKIKLSSTNNIVSGNLNDDCQKELKNESDDESKLSTKDSNSSENLNKDCKEEKSEQSVVRIKVAMNFIYFAPKFMKKLTNTIRKKMPYFFEHDIKVVHDPFTLCMLPNFIESEAFVKQLKKEILRLPMKNKKCDLFQFQQSLDLGDYKKPCIFLFVKILKTVVLSYVKKITGIPLSNNVSVSASRYNQNDYLLCHDDKLENRKIAFIYYLNEEWEESDGGTLDLFSSANGEPVNVKESLVPGWNQFVFFEVTDLSFHQVSEVLTPKSRLSINGWFYGPTSNKVQQECKRFFYRNPNCDEFLVLNWIDPSYLVGLVQIDIRKRFEKKSEISLSNFLQKNKYKEVCEALKSCRIQWNERGPPNKRRFYEVEYSTLPPVVYECLRVFSSEIFLLLLSNISSLQFHPASGEGAKMGKVYTCLRKWTAGSYTLLNDKSYCEEDAIHAVMHFNVDDWDTESGGSMKYIDDEDQKQLLEIVPQANFLSLVYNESKVSSFVQYVNKKVNARRSPYFFDIYSMYIESKEENIP